MKKLCTVLGVVMLVVMILPACQSPAPSETEPYKIGYSSDLTGPGAASTAVWATGFRIFCDELNQQGGINGHKVIVSLDDNRSDPAKAAAHATKYVEEGANLIFVAASSGTHKAILPKAAAANIPLFTLPPGMEESIASPPAYVFNTRIGLSAQISGLMSNVILKVGKPPLKVMVIGADIPASRSEAQMTAAALRKNGAEASEDFIPLAATDFRAWASKIVEGGYNFVSMSAFGPMMFGLPAALQPLGWKGTLYTSPLISPDAVLYKMKMENLMIYSWCSTKVAPECANAAKKYEVESNAQLMGGWMDGMMAKEILRRAGWPASKEKVMNVLDNFEFDRSPYEGPIKWTKDDHAGSLTFWTMGWSKEKGIFQIIEPLRVDSRGNVK